MFPSGMWKYHNGTPDISRALSKTVRAVKLRSENCFLVYYSRILTIMIFFANDKGDFLNEYPNAGNLIDKIPASSSAGCKCFKPEAHLLIIFEQIKISLFFYYCGQYDHIAHQS